MSGLRTFGLIVFLCLTAGCRRDFDPFPIAVAIPETGPTEERTCSAGAFWYDWTCYEKDRLTAWGFGEREYAYRHNDRPYAWYIDQAQTGPASGNNCGPSSVVMAAKWHDEAFAGTVEEARDLYPNDGGWWYTSDVVNYFDDRSIPYLVFPFTGSERMEQLLEEGSLLLLCIDTGYIPMGMVSEKRVGRFYAYAGGHFLIVKGSRRVDDAHYFEVYDPNNWFAVYRDGSQKGKNRHYRASDLSRAISNWWKYLVVIYPEGATPAATAKAQGVDPGTIEHAWGR